MWGSLCYNGVVTIHELPYQGLPIGFDWNAVQFQMPNSKIRNDLYEISVDLVKQPFRGKNQCGSMDQRAQLFEFLSINK